MSDETTARIDETDTGRSLWGMVLTVTCFMPLGTLLWYGASGAASPLGDIVLLSLWGASLPLWGEWMRVMRGSRKVVTIPRARARFAKLKG